MACRQVTAWNSSLLERGWFGLGTVAHEVPFVLTAIALPLLNAIMIPVAVAALGFAWVLPELYAARGAGKVKISLVPRNSQDKPHKPVVLESVVIERVA